MNPKQYIKLFLLIIITVICISCNKDDNAKQRSGDDNNLTQNDNEGGSDDDSTLTPEEAFSSALVQEILRENDDIDLQIYLEEKIFPLVSKSDKVTIDRIASSQYLLTYDEGGTMKNLLIQKYYSPGKDEFVFEMKGTLPVLK